MRFIKTPLHGLYVIGHKKLTDERGLFARTFCKQEFSQIGFTKELVQFNHSFNIKKGTIRGMHYQRHPFPESKLIRCVQGRVFDVAIDIRKNSPTFLGHFGIELSEENMFSIFIPEGFAHGFQTLEPNTSLIYHHSEYYTPQADAGIRYDDPVLAGTGMFLEKGVPKSLFRPGSSTVVLLFEKARVSFDQDIVANMSSGDGISIYSQGFGKSLLETDVKVRSLIGYARRAGNVNYGATGYVQ